MSENKSELNLRQRIFNFQQDEIHIQKDKQAYGYKYAPLDVILPLINPFLKKHGIGFFHSTKNIETTFNGTLTNAQVLVTTFFNYDKPEDEITCETLINEKVQLSKMNEFMVVGSAITYYRRYHIVTILGLITDEDSDAGGSKPNTSNTTTSSSGKTKQTTTSNSGRSVEKAGSEDTVDYIGIFDNITKTKDEATCRKMLDTYSKNMSADVKTKVEKIINDKFKK